MDDRKGQGSWALGGVPQASLLFLMTMSESRNFCTALTAMGRARADDPPASQRDRTIAELHERRRRMGVDGGNVAIASGDGNMPFLDVIIEILVMVSLSGPQKQGRSFPYAPLCLSFLNNIGAFVRETRSETASNLFMLLRVFSDPGTIFASPSSPENLRDIIQVILTALQHLRKKKVGLRALILLNESRIRELGDVEGAFLETK